MLRDVMILIFFVIFAYSVMLLHILEGTLSHRCLEEQNVTAVPCSSIHHMKDCHPRECAWDGIRGCIDNVLSDAEVVECPSTIKCVGGDTNCVAVPAVLVADKVRRHPRMTALVSKDNQPHSNRADVCRKTTVFLVLTIFPKHV